MQRVLFLALADILLSIAEPLYNFSRGFHKWLTFKGNYFEFRTAVQEEMLFKRNHIFSSCGHFVWQSRSFWTILVKGLMRNIWMKLF